MHGDVMKPASDSTKNTQTKDSQTTALDLPIDTQPLDAVATHPISFGFIGPDDPDYATQVELLQQHYEPKIIQLCTTHHESLGTFVSQFSNAYYDIYCRLQSYFCSQTEGSLPENYISASLADFFKIINQQQLWQFTDAASCKMGLNYHRFKDYAEQIKDTKLSAALASANQTLESNTETKAAQQAAAEVFHHFWHEHGEEFLNFSFKTYFMCSNKDLLAMDNFHMTGFDNSNRHPGEHLFEEFKKLIQLAIKICHQHTECDQIIPIPIVMFHGWLYSADVCCALKKQLDQTSEAITNCRSQLEHSKLDLNATENLDLTLQSSWTTTLNMAFCYWKNIAQAFQQISAYEEIDEPELRLIITDANNLLEYFCVILIHSLGQTSIPNPQQSLVEQMPFLAMLGPSYRLPRLQPAFCEFTTEGEKKLTTNNKLMETFNTFESSLEAQNGALADLTAQEAFQTQTAEHHRQTKHTPPRSPAPATSRPRSRRGSIDPGLAFSPLPLDQLWAALQPDSQPASPTSRTLSFNSDTSPGSTTTDPSSSKSSASDPMTPGDEQTTEAESDTSKASATPGIFCTYSAPSILPGTSRSTGRPPRPAPNSCSNSPPSPGQFG